MTGTYILGFKDLHDAEPDMIGDAVSNEGSAHDPDGDATIGALQDTEHGLLVYSARRNRAVFVQMDDPAAPAPTPPPVPAPVRQLLAVDCSSNNGIDIGGLLDRYRPDVLIAKAYQNIELGGNGARYTIAHAKAARERGIAVLFYFWIYGSIPGAQQAASALDTIRRTGINPPIIFADAETYVDSTYPTIGTITEAVQEIERQGYVAGCYTGSWFWKGYLGNTKALGDRPLWLAQYDGIKTLDSAVPPGGWAQDKIVAKQYSGNPVDLSVIRSDVAGV